MPHIGHEVGKLRLHVRARAVPANQRSDREAMPLMPRAA